jgi:hypothetical protein
MNYKAAILVLAGLSLGGCRTEITREEMMPVTGTPYHKLLICTLSGDPSRASLMETTLAGRLQRHGIVADRCTDVYPRLRGTSVNQAVANIQAQAYDAVLIVQRKPVPPYPKLQDFFTAYEKGIPIVPKNSAPLDGTASILAVKENAMIWSADGLLYGDPNAPLAGIFKEFARTIDGRLEDQGIVPSGSHHTPHH